MKTNTFPEHCVALHSVPRSGSSWLGQIFKSSPHVEFRFQPLFSYAFKDFLDPESDQKRIFEFMHAINVTDDDYVLQRVPDLLVGYPEFKPQEAIASHLVWKEVRYHHILENLLRTVPELQLVGLVRHPCAVIHSWLSAPREFKPGWNVDEEWREAPKKNSIGPEEFNGYVKWMEVARMFVRFEREYPDRFKLVRYVDLNIDPLRTTQELFNFCGIPFEQRTRDFIASSRSMEVKDPNSVYRLAQRDDKWKAKLPDYIAKQIVEETEAAGLDRFLE